MQRECVKFCARNSIPPSHPPLQVLGGPCTPSSPSSSFSAYAQILFSGIGQIYLVGDPIAGALMLAGTIVCSRVCAACMCAGVVIGSLVGAFLGASLCDLASGLYGCVPSSNFDACVVCCVLCDAACAGTTQV